MYAARVCLACFATREFAKRLMLSTLAEEDIDANLTNILDS